MPVWQSQKEFRLRKRGSAPESRSRNRAESSRSRAGEKLDVRLIHAVHDLIAADKIFPVLDPRKHRALRSDREVVPRTGVFTVTLRTNTGPTAFGTRFARIGARLVAPASAAAYAYAGLLYSILFHRAAASGADFNDIADSAAFTEKLNRLISADENHFTVLHRSPVRWR